MLHGEPRGGTPPGARPYNSAQLLAVGNTLELGCEGRTDKARPGECGCAAGTGGDGY